MKRREKIATKRRSDGGRAGVPPAGGTRAGRPCHPTKISAIPRLALSGDELAQALGISARYRRTLSESGRLPQPNLCHGRVQRWSIDEIRAWLLCGCPSAKAWAKMTPSGRLTGS